MKTPILASSKNKYNYYMLERMCDEERWFFFFGLFQILLNEQEISRYKIRFHCSLSLQVLFFIFYFFKYFFWYYLTIKCLNFHLQFVFCNKWKCPAHCASYKLVPNNDGTIDYSSLTYGDIISSINKTGLGLCNDLRLN